jgi:hypothetical protein
MLLIGNINLLDGKDNTQKTVKALLNLIFCGFFAKKGLSA